jgi:hypothetical protein
MKQEPKASLLTKEGPGVVIFRPEWSTLKKAPPQIQQLGWDKISLT